MDYRLNPKPITFLYDRNDLILTFTAYGGPSHRDVMHAYITDLYERKVTWWGPAEPVLPQIKRFSTVLKRRAQVLQAEIQKYTSRRIRHTPLCSSQTPYKGQLYTQSRIDDSFDLTQHCLRYFSCWISLPETLPPFLSQIRYFNIYYFKIWTRMLFLVKCGVQAVRIFVKLTTSKPQQREEKENLQSPW